MKHLSEVNLLGLNEFGEPEGLPPLYGAFIGAGAPAIVSALVRMATDKGSSWYMKSDDVGFGVGAAAALGLWAMPSTRRAGVMAGLGLLVSAGVRFVERHLMGSAALGLPQVDYLNGFGLPQVDYLNGAMGLPAATPQSPAYGMINGGSIAGASLSESPPVDLLGQSAQSDQVNLLGGPQTSNLAGAYGGTIWG